jgi:hypothetical protein
MIGPIDQALIHLLVEEVSVRAGHKDLVENDDNSALIVVDPQGILGQQLRSPSICLLNIGLMT